MEFAINLIHILLSLTIKVVLLVRIYKSLNKLQSHIESFVALSNTLYFTLVVDKEIVFYNFEL